MIGFHRNVVTLCRTWLGGATSLIIDNPATQLRRRALCSVVPNRDTANDRKWGGNSRTYDIIAISAAYHAAGH